MVVQRFRPCPKLKCARTRSEVDQEANERAYACILSELAVGDEEVEDVVAVALVEDNDDAKVNPVWLVSLSLESFGSLSDTDSADHSLHVLQAGVCTCTFGSI